MEDNRLTVELDGRNVEITVFDIIDNLDANKKYIVYSIDGFEDEFFISILDEDETSYTLKKITDENEYKMVEDYLDSMMGEEENNG